ncbi:diguanylate cyclase domain-containing protein [Exiguobacterium chiriqhucha]|uniref:sensor domain-containing diguanylate cyclase n=1 Tax=Exiguobacterium chiriqhucha TaxID=1385984 RepID=UPI000735EC25|nr:sensor domain-containing diguanylate cyclase [Exiguobacterium chiriqhucha]
MNKQFEELKMYESFDELANDVLDLANEILPEQMFYLTAFTDSQQVILKLSNQKSSIQITENMVVDLSNSVCNRIDFENNQPLRYEDIKRDCDVEEVERLLDDVNIRSYLGIPISLTNGEKFGTLCAVNDEASLLDPRSITLLQRIVKLFSYYLELERFVWRDMLTELYNRRYLTKYFEDGSNAHGALFFLDLDGFKSVNDRYGHDIGDTVLQEVAARLQTIVNEQGDAFAVRLGGDEFVLHFSQAAGRDEWSHIATQMIDELSKWDEGYEVSTSIGIVTYIRDERTTLAALLKQADEALYQAKSAGKRTFKFVH